MKKTGIYKITSPTGRVYIGQSVNIQQRLNGYKNLINCKNQPKLYRSLCKYGPELHIMNAIEHCDPSELNERERYWQDFYDAASKNNLNCLLTGTKSKKMFFSQETKNKISKSQIGRKQSPETKSKRLASMMKTINHPNYARPPLSESSRVRISESSKKNPAMLSNLAMGGNKGYPVIQLSTKLEIIKEWDNLTEASTSLNIDRGSISRCVKGRLNHAGGFLWSAKYKEHINNSTFIFLSIDSSCLVLNSDHYPHNKPIEKIRPRTPYKSISVFFVDSKKTMHFKTAKEASVFAKVHECTIRKYCSGVVSNPKGFIYKYII